MIRFAQSQILLWWLVLPAIALAVGWALSHSRALLDRLGSRVMIRRLTASAGLDRRVSKAALFLLAGFLLILAWARPQFGRIDQPVTRRGIDVVLAVDLSTSMLAEDVAPSRIDLAKAFAAELAARLEGNRVGLVAFAGSAFPQCPLTLDRSAVRLFLDIMEVGDVPDVGSNLEEALEVARGLFPEESPGRRVIVLLSDGEGHEGRAVDAATAAGESGTVTYTVGTGTASGGPIPLRDADGSMRGYKKDGEGRVVTTRLDGETLRAVAAAGRGRFVLASPGLGEARGLADEIDRMEKADISSRIITTYEERFQWPLLLAILVLVCESLISPGRRLSESA